MLVEVKVPQLSESVSEATLLTWHKKAGEYVQRDENLIDIETDKVVLELPAPESGVLKTIVKADGGTVTSNEVIATIDTEAKAGAAAPAPQPKPAAAEKPASAPRGAPAPAVASASEPIAMPAARKLATEKGVELTAIAGTGRGGRITKEDVAAQVARPAARPGRSTMPTSARSTSCWACCARVKPWPRACCATSTWILRRRGSRS